jgi:hypothetical protein
MRKHSSNVCKLRPCLATESTNSVRMRTIVTAALQRQYSQTEFILWITLVNKNGRNYIGCVEARVYLVLSRHCEFPIFQK